jgi:hypothetical protein
MNLPRVLLKAETSSMSSRQIDAADSRKTCISNKG